MPPGLPTTAVHDAAQALLAAVETGYLAELAEPAALPDHRLVTPGAPAYDCPGLYVHVERLFTTDGNLALDAVQPQLASVGHALRGMQVGLHLIRCAAAGTAASRDSDEAWAAIIHADAVLVWRVLVEAQRAGDLPFCADLAHVEWVSVEPSGGYSGGVTRVRMMLSRSASGS